MRFACHTRQLNGAVLPMWPKKPRPHVTIRIPLSQRPLVPSIGKTFSSPSVMSPSWDHESENSLEGRYTKDKQMANKQTNKYSLKTQTRATSDCRTRISDQTPDEIHDRYLYLCCFASYSRKFRTNEDVIMLLRPLGFAYQFNDKQIEGGGSTYYLF